MSAEPTDPFSAAYQRPPRKAHAKRSTEHSEVIILQKIAYEKALDPKVSDRDKVQYLRAYDILSERRRILKGKVKAGSRNVSVRELAEPKRKVLLDLPAYKPSDFLQQAQAAADSDGKHA